MTEKRMAYITSWFINNYSSIDSVSHKDLTKQQIAFIDSLIRAYKTGFDDATANASETIGSLVSARLDNNYLYGGDYHVE